MCCPRAGKQGGLEQELPGSDLDSNRTLLPAGRVALSKMPDLSVLWKMRMITFIV